MRVEPLVPDVASPPAPGPSQAGSAFARLVDAAATQLDRADAAERAFAAGGGDLQRMIVERARADIDLAVASTGVQRAAQALTTLLGMQI